MGFELLRLAWSPPQTAYCTATWIDSRRGFHATQDFFAAAQQKIWIQVVSAEKALAGAASCGQAIRSPPSVLALAKDCSACMTSSS